MLRVVPGTSGASPSPNLRVNLCIMPASDDYLRMQAHAGPDESEFAVPMSRLVQIHEVHVDGRPRQFFIELRVQMQIRLCYESQRATAQYFWEGSLLSCRYAQHS